MKIEEVCSYLKDVLNFRDFIELPENRSDYFCISNEEFKNGQIEMTEPKKRLLNKWLENEKNKSNYSQPEQENEDKAEDVGVLIIPKLVCDIIPVFGNSISCNKDRAWEYRKVSLLYIKAKCNAKTLKLKSIQKESLIWADPLICQKSVSPIALIFKFKKLIAKLIKKKEENGIRKFEFWNAPGIESKDYEWKEYISLIDDSFHTRTGKSLFDADSLKDEDGVSHELYAEGMNGKCIVMKDDTVIATKNIRHLLSNIPSKSKTKELLLFKTMVGGTQKRKEIFSYPTDTDMPNYKGPKKNETVFTAEPIRNRPSKIFSKSKTIVLTLFATMLGGIQKGKNFSMADHKGQMKNEFPLANAQRAAVHAFSKLEDGEVLAVSGPPGTGKTTMLQSIVAQMLVDNALKGNDAPLILATSANNKAITNIIDAFSTVNTKDSKNPMHERWITYYTNSISNSDINSEPQIECPVPMAIYLPSAAAAKKRNANYFISNEHGGYDYEALRNKYYQNQDCSDFIEMARNALGNSNNINSVGEIKTHLTKKLEVCKRELESKAKPYGHENAMEIDRAMDTEERYEMYWLAVHYYECLWIDKILEYQKTGELRKVYGKFFLEEVKLVCPCIIATFFRAPKIFQYEIKRIETYSYNYELADLLIVDEAGQVSPEIGLPTFALAKKAVVVGDVAQIPPVHNIPETNDADYWEKNIKSDYNAEFQSLMSCAKSSIMAIAESQCKFQRRTKSGNLKNGLFLNEHRRCVDEIIDYSNKLIYNGELLPKRGRSINKAVCKWLPPMGIYIHESDSETKNGSRFNKLEINAICDWVEKYESEIRDSYGGKKIDELVCIITPFKAQSELLKSDGRLKNIPIGTVHTFQGAESPIVIFSMVYGEKDNPVFIKKNHELMNVAVSRAKDSFLVFGSRRCLELNQSDPACGLLYKKLQVMD